MRRAYLLLAILAVLLVGLVWIRRTTGSAVERAPAGRPPPEPPAKVREPLDVPDPRDSGPPAPAKPLEVRNAEIARVDYEGGRFTLWLTDGRRVQLRPDEVERLPPEVKDRILYRRGGGPRR